MSTESIRKTIIEVLHDVNAAKDVKPSLLAAFENAGKDIRLKDLHLGSLARMELLVALEMEHRAVIDPREFPGFKTLEDIVARVAQKSDAGAVTGAPDNLAATASSPALEPGEERPPVVRLFQRAFRSCRAVSQVHKLLKILEHRLTPMEFATLRGWHQRGVLIAPNAPAHFEAVLDEWLVRLAGMIEGSGKAEPEPFSSQRVAPAAIHFVGPGERGKKTLLVCFATIGGRQLWMPNAVLLQHTDAREYDLLVISDPWATGFRSGVPLLGKSVNEVVEWIAALVWIGDYRRVRTLGCSAGAYPAMLTARRLDAELAVSISGRFPENQRRHMGEILGIYFNSWVAARRNARARVLMIHGKRRRDRAYARNLAWLTGANRLWLQMPGLMVRHNLLRPLMEHRALGYFLRHTLFAPANAALLTSKRTRAWMTIPVDQSAAAPELIVSR